MHLKNRYLIATGYKSTSFGFDTNIQEDLFLELALTSIKTTMKYTGTKVNEKINANIFQGKNITQKLYAMVECYYG